MRCLGWIGLPAAGFDHSDGHSDSQKARPVVCRAILSLLLLGTLLIPSALTAGGVEVHRRTGRLAVRSPFSPIIAVDLRDGDMAGFVVGRIAADSRLRRGEESIGLQDFEVGETVRVTWEKTAEGTEILTLQADPAPPPAEMMPLRRSPGDIGALIGRNRQHRVAKGETFLDIARRYDLGFNEITSLHPQHDPWLPPVGEVVEIPGRWLLPDSAFSGLVINIPEMRLFAYRREEGKATVSTFPIGIGDTDFPTPTGTYRVGTKRRHPTWYVPPSLRAKYQQAAFPPGPDNPLGDYWIGLENTMYGIHGTDIPWSVGRLVTRGCIRMYPEDIAEFFPTVSKGMPVRLVYQPVKVAFISGRLLVEVHRDVYGRTGNLAVHGLDLIGRLGLVRFLDQMKFVRAIVRQNGLPTDITLEDDTTDTAPANGEKN